MNKCYQNELVMPSNYVVVSEEEMMTIDGGIDLVTTITLVGATYGGGRALGVYAYNNGYSRKGLFRNLVTSVWGPIGSIPVLMGFDDGWVAASKA